MAIGFYFTCQGKRVRLPVNPEEITVKRQGNNQQTEVVALGEVTILRDTRLAGISLECLLPEDSYYPFVTGEWMPPQDYIAFFRKAMEGKKPVQMVVSGLGINMKVSVEELEETRVAGDHESILCKLGLLQYRAYGATLLTMPRPEVPLVAAAAKREVSLPENRTHLVQAGESFWAIAQKELGDGTRYKEIAALNNMTAASVIHPGDSLELPPR